MLQENLVAGAQEELAKVLCEELQRKEVTELPFELRKRYTLIERQSQAIQTWLPNRLTRILAATYLDMAWRITLWTYSRNWLPGRDALWLRR